MAQLELTPSPDGKVIPFTGKIAGQNNYDLRAAVVVTPSMAAKLLENCKYAMQRKLKNHSMSHLVTAMERDQFKTGMIELAEVSAEEVYLIDGQHRLTAIVEYNRPAYLDIKVWNVNSVADVGALYARTDAGMVRPAKEQVKAITPKDVNSPYLVQVSCAVGIIQSDYSIAISQARNLTRSPDIMVERYHAYEEAAERIYSLIGPAGGGGGVIGIKSLFHRAPILSVILSTMHYQPHRTTELIEEVLANDGLAKGSAAWYIVNKLFLMRAGGSVERQAQISVMASIWNIHYQGKKVQNLKHSGGRCKLLGTPIDV